MMYALIRSLKNASSRSTSTSGTFFFLFEYAIQTFLPHFSFNPENIIMFTHERMCLLGVSQGTVCA